MPDLREVFEMTTKQMGEPDVDSWQEQGRRQRRASRNKKIGAFAVAAAIAVVAVVWIVSVGGAFDRTQTPAVPGGTETGPTVAPDPDAEGLNGLPPEGATPSTPESGELVVEVSDQEDKVWVYADGRMISKVYLPTLEPYSGLVEQHLTPEGVEFLRSNVLSTGLFEHDLDLAKFADLQCCLFIRVRDGDRLVWVRYGPRYALSDRQAPTATPEQVTALRSLSALLTRPASWPASVWTDQQIRGYVPTSYSFCSRAEPSRVLALLPQRARDLLGAGYLKTDGPVHCSRTTTEEVRALAGILIADPSATRHANPSLIPEGGSALQFSLEKPEGHGKGILIAINPVLPHGPSAGWAGLG